MSKFFFILSKGLDKAGGATRAVQFASIAADQGHAVELFLAVISGGPKLMGMMTSPDYKVFTF